MHRRHFLHTAAGGCLAHVLAQVAAASPTERRRALAAPSLALRETPFARLEPVGTGAWAVISTPFDGDRTTFANGGLVAGRTGVVAVEGFYTPAGAAWLAAESRRLTGRWPTHVVITHYHVDHAAGTAAYDAEGAPPQVHLTDVTRTLALGGGRVAPRADDALRRRYADVVLVDPSAGATIDLGDRMLRLLPQQGHTASDLMVHDADASLLFTGDLFWNAIFPNFVDATPPALREAAVAIDALAATRLVPGHGALADRATFARYAGLLDALAEAATRARRDGTPAAEAARAFTMPPTVGEWMANPASIARAFEAWERVSGR